MWKQRLTKVAVVGAMVLVCGCGDDAPEVVVATMPAKAKPYPRIANAPGVSPGARVSRFDARRIIGMRVDPARRLAARYDCTLRVVEGEGAAKAFTADLNLRRIDVRVEHGVVTRLTAP
ncbi:hypothetical protein AB0L40_04255 [Patulibacter sp. NPDC049589]|uniref:hypothetical protein n=1 Tax=Patulibacter sp. NPDC049589 TaxID=3154731 RepID=UPI0034354F4E